MKNINRMKQLKNDQRGASLAYTLVIITILMIIGGALATFAVVSLRISVMQHASDKAFYLSDAAMEETLTQLESFVHEAEIYALNRVNDYDRYYEEPKWIDFLQKLEIDTNNKTISKERSAELLNQATSFEFHKQYYHFLFNKPSETTWLITDYELLNEDGNYSLANTIEFNSNSFDATYFDTLKDISLDLSTTEGFKGTNKPSMSVIATFSDNLIKLELTSNGQYNTYQKPIEVNVSLTTPDYTQVIASETSTVTVHKNQILEYALASKGDIVVSGGKSTINGDLYAYGTFPERSDYKISEQGGVLVGYNKDTKILNFPYGILESPNELTTTATLNVTGNLYSRSGVKLFGDSSKLKVNKDLYANAIQFDSSSTDANIEIDHNAYLMEDLILDGIDPVITIGKDDTIGTGELWGIMENLPSGASTAGRSDLSASIIVNSKSKNPKITVNNAFIAGVAYYNIFTKDVSSTKSYYQTGESFTTNKNFYFYNTPLVGYNSSIQSKFFTYEDEKGATYTMIEAINDKGQIEQSPEFKAKYFYESSNASAGAVSDRDRNIFRIRSLQEKEGNVINLESNFSLGTFIANKKVIDAYPKVGLASGEKPVSELMDSGVFTGRKNDLLKIIDKNLNVLSTRNYRTNLNQDPNKNVTTSSRLGEFVDFSKSSITEISNPNKIIVVAKNEEQNVYVNVPSELISSIKSKDQNSIVIPENIGALNQINGIIITRGNVFIYNTRSTPFQYNGTVVSDKNIFLLGDGEKNFTNNLNWIMLTVAHNPLLASTLHADSGRITELVSGTSSNNASLSINITENPSSVLITVDQTPTGSGLIKSTTEHSFTINNWSVKK